VVLVLERIYDLILVQGLDMGVIFLGISTQGVGKNSKESVDEK